MWQLWDCKKIILKIYLQIDHLSSNVVKVSAVSLGPRMTTCRRWESRPDWWFCLITTWIIQVFIFGWWDPSRLTSIQPFGSFMLILEEIMIIIRRNTYSFNFFIKFLSYKVNNICREIVRLRIIFVEFIPGFVTRNKCLDSKCSRIFKN